MPDLRPLDYDDEFDPEESIFSRDVGGQLIKVVPAQQNDYDRTVSLVIDGHPVTVKLAMPMTDAQGNIVRDKEGMTTPRYTTLYDAAREAARQHAGYRNEIPILCHQEHLHPVAVCRICMVEVRGKERRENGLVPACQFRVKEGLDVHTHQSADADAVRRITSTVKVLTELLAADHLFAGCRLVERARRRGRLQRVDGPGSAVLSKGVAVSFALDRPRAGRLVAGHRRQPRLVHFVRPLRAGLHRRQAQQHHRPHGQRLHHAHRFRPERQDGPVQLRFVRRVHDFLPDRRPDVPFADRGPEAAIVAARSGLRVGRPGRPAPRAPAVPRPAV